jgi:hypothetical protein
MMDDYANLCGRFLNERKWDDCMLYILYNHAKQCFFFHSYCCMMYIYIHMKFLLFRWSWLSLTGCKMRKPTRVCVYHISLLSPGSVETNR